MPSRRMRKRYRLEVESTNSTAEATAKTPGFAGGWGRGLPLQGRDLAMIRQAVREDWPTPQPVRDRIVDELMDVFENADARLSIRLVRLFIAMDLSQLRDLERELGEPGGRS